MLRYFFAIFALLVVMVVAWAGFRGQKFQDPPIELFPDMDRQPKVKAQVPSNFFENDLAARKPVDGTVPLGYAMPQHAEIDGSSGTGASPYTHIQFGSLSTYENTGMIGDSWGTGLPMEITPELMARGKERYSIYCAVCHGATGGGNGVASKYNWPVIANLLEERIVDMADGEIFNTISHGKNQMYGYGASIPVPDRWAIILYIRALQTASNAPVSVVPESELAKLDTEVTEE